MVSYRPRFPPSITRAPRRRITGEIPTQTCGTAGTARHACKLPCHTGAEIRIFDRRAPLCYVKYPSSREALDNRSIGKAVAKRLIVRSAFVLRPRTDQGDHVVVIGLEQPRLVQRMVLHQVASRPCHTSATG